MKPRNPNWRFHAATLGLLASASAVVGQAVLDPGAVWQETPAIVPPSRPSPVEGGEAPSTGGATLSEHYPLKWGPVTFRPHVAYRFLYGDGVQFRPGNPVTTALNEISPGILMELGKHWTLDYTPQLAFYSSKDFKDTLNHNVALQGGTTYQEWTLGLSQTVSITSSPQIETGTQTDQQNYITALSAHYAFSRKMSMDLGLDQSIRLASQYSSSAQWSTMDWLNYQFLPAFSAGLGAGFGFINRDQGSDMTFEQLMARISWQPTRKLSVQIQGGADDRQFLTGDVGNLLNPVYGGSITWQPFTVTTLSLHANRAVNSSYFADQITENTDLGASLRQRLLKRFYLDLTGGYQITSYASSSSFVTASREDNYSYFRVRLSTVVFKKGSAGVFYQISRNDSNQNGYSFDGHQVGVELAYRF